MVGTRHGLDVNKAGKKRGRPRLNIVPQSHDLVLRPSSAGCNGSSSAEAGQSQANDSVAPHPLATSALAARPTMCNLSPNQKQRLVADVNELLYTNSVAASPRLDMLLTLTHFNVFRALVGNTISMGFDMAWLTGDAISPFFTAGQSLLGANCPVNLRPTLMQFEVEHHPWIDLFPFPALRDNLLAADGNYDEDQLCLDLIEFCHVPRDQEGLIVWGEPGDPASWEVSEAFLRKWAWVLKGCGELHQSTNYWRESRGEKALVWEL